jgi:two-component system chemotaxis sensor kinase CheA
MDEIIAEFINEIEDDLVVVEEKLSVLELQGNDPEAVSAIFRVMHTIKGTSGFLSLDKLHSISEQCEELLNKIRETSCTGKDIAVIELSKGIAQIKEVIGNLKSHGVEELIQEGNNLGKDLETLRVKVSILDDTMNGVGELLLVKNQLLAIAKTQAEIAPIITPAVKKLSAVVKNLKELTAIARLQPVANIWHGYDKMIKELEVELGKKLNLELIGEDIELDRGIVSQLKDCFVHMIRNSADHGIETVEDRIAHGKKSEGKITINAYQEGAYTVFIVKDDGRGLNRERIKNKLKEKEILSDSEIEDLSNHKLYNYIFHPGFSTAEAVTDISGRGVGMDVVKSNIEEVGGIIIIDSQEGVGTTFTIKIPLTLTIISALVVSINGFKMALPMSNIKDIIKIDRVDLEFIECDQYQVLKFNDAVMPVYNMPNSSEDNKRAYAVILDIAGFTTALLVDAKHDIEELVINPISPPLHSNKMLGGVAILGNGEIISIVDVRYFIDKFSDFKRGDFAEYAMDNNDFNFSDVANTEAIVVFKLTDKSDFSAVLAKFVIRVIELGGDELDVPCAFNGQAIQMVNPQQASAEKQYIYQIIIYEFEKKIYGLIVHEICEILNCEIIIEKDSSVIMYNNKSIKIDELNSYSNLKMDAA